MAPAVHPKRASLPLPGGSEGAGVTVTPMRTAEMLTQPRFFQRPSGPLATARGLGLLTPKSKWTWVPVPCFLVEHPTAGAFLIDTGLPPAASHDVRAALGRRAAIVYDIRMEDGWAVTDQLVALGLDPLGIGRGRLTHMHHDHVGAVAQLPRATFVVDGREWQGAIDSGFLHGYRRALYDYDYDWRALDFGAEQVDSFASFGHAIDLFARRLRAAALDARAHEGAHERAAAPAVRAASSCSRATPPTRGPPSTRSSCRSSATTCTATCARCARSGATSS